MSHLLSLPVLPKSRKSAQSTNTVIESYLNEVRKVTTAEALTKHVKRWMGLWGLVPGSREVLKDFPDRKLVMFLSYIQHHDIALSEGTIENPAEVLKSMYDEQLEERWNNDELTDADMLAISMLIPQKLIVANILAKKLNVTTDHTLVTAFLESYPELDTKLV